MFFLCVAPVGHAITERLILTVLWIIICDSTMGILGVPCACVFGEEEEGGCVLFSSYINFE